jgi:hypothetical protein
MAKARLLGLDIERSQAMVGSPEEFAQAQSSEAVLENIRERMGSGAARRVSQFVEREQRIMSGEASDDESPLLEHDASPFDPEPRG